MTKMRYAVVHLYCTENGTTTGYSKPERIYSNLDDARLEAKRTRTLKNGPGWIVRLHNDGSATIMGQVWYLRERWVYETYMTERCYILNKDGSIGAKTEWSR